jgi:hypothetical protein
MEANMLVKTKSVATLDVPVARSFVGRIDSVNQEGVLVDCEGMLVPAVCAKSCMMQLHERDTVWVLMQGDQAFVMSVLDSIVATPTLVFDDVSVSALGTFKLEAKNLDSQIGTVKGKVQTLITHVKTSLQQYGQHRVQAELIDEQCSGIKRTRAKSILQSAKRISLTAAKVLIN